MDALILCGGFATRLEPITLFVPKPLLPVGDRPILDHIMDSIAALGIERIVLSTNKKFGGQFRYWAENRMASGFKAKIEIVVEPTIPSWGKIWRNKRSRLHGRVCEVEKRPADNCRGQFLCL